MKYLTLLLLTLFLSCEIEEISEYNFQCFVFVEDDKTSVVINTVIEGATFTFNGVNVDDVKERDGLYSDNLFKIIPNNTTGPINEIHYKITTPDGFTEEGHITVHTSENNIEMKLVSPDIYEVTDLSNISNIWDGTLFIYMNYGDYIMDLDQFRLDSNPDTIDLSSNTIWNYYSDISFHVSSSRYYEMQNYDSAIIVKRLTTPIFR